MQTSRPDNLPSMSTHNSDQPKPGNLMTTSESVQGSLESAFCPSSSTLLDSPGLYSQDQFIDPFSMWRLGYSSNHTALERPDGVIEKSSQLVHGCYFVKEKEGLFPVRMGLNLGGAETTACIGGPSQKTSHGNTFRSTESSSFTGSQISQCQAEGCKANLNRAKHYHRRHKICELHSKASAVVVGGLIQRFCQQCSRFHPRSQFDEEKRSCRKSLAEHNRRRRRPQRSPCTRSHGLVGTTALHNDKQKTKGLSGLQIVPDMISCTSTTQPLITSVALSSSWPMMMFPNTDKGRTPVLQRTSSDKRSCLDIHYADIAPTGSELSQEGHIIFDKQTESSDYQTGYPCSLRHPHLALEIP